MPYRFNYLRFVQSTTVPTGGKSLWPMSLWPFGLWPQLNPFGDLSRVIPTAVTAIVMEGVEPVSGNVRSIPTGVSAITTDL